MFADELYDTSPDRLDWTRAACRRQPGLTGLFFSDNITDINAAKGVCAGCPLLEPCLRGAILREEPGGVWGGQLFVHGRILAQKRRRGRPPKVRPAEPELVLPPGIAELLAELAEPAELDRREARSA